MRIFKFIGTALFTLFIFANLTSCGGENNKTKEGQKALDAAVKREVRATDIQNSYIQSREYYKNQGDKKNADYYDQKVKEQSKEIKRLHQETEKIRKDVYGEVFK